MHLTLEFGGGLELLLDKSTKVHKVDVQPNDGDGKVVMKGLLAWVKSNLIKERPEMFLKGDSVRPGVLVLINDCDWELCGGLDAELEEKDVVVFISTLHGGNYPNQIMRVILERLAVRRLHPWGLQMTSIELIKNPRYKLWSRPFIRCGPEIDKVLIEFVDMLNDPRLTSLYSSFRSIN